MLEIPIVGTGSGNDIIDSGEGDDFNEGDD